MALAHNGPEHEIEDLTDRLSKEGESADLLLQRAIEYQVMGKHPEAAKDLERALSFDSHSVTIQRELSRAYFAIGKTNEALQTVTRALEAATAGPDRGSLLIIRAQFLQARKETKKAVEDADRSLSEDPANVEWYLFRSQLQARLKLKKERIAGLEAGIKQTGGGVLEAEWVDALVDDGQHDLALEKIETELNDSRWRSSWLIRRAKVRIARDKGEDAKSDLNAAVAELNRRINPAWPDPSLLADRGTAYELLGNKEAARKDYEDARDKGFAEDWLIERIRVLKETDPKDAKK
jgi:tetratricopeptide (TPR) repeat protein